MSRRPDPERQLAKATLSLTYPSSRPCRHGHQSTRYTSTGACFDCVADQAKGRYQSRKARAALPAEIVEFIG